MKLERITVDPKICTGKPCIRGLRFPVTRLLGLLAAGETRETILTAYPYLESKDIDEVLHYSAQLADNSRTEWELKLHKIDALNTKLHDENTYPKGIRIFDEEMASINLERHDFHGEWNYTISPKRHDNL